LIEFYNLASKIAVIIFYYFKVAYIYGYSLLNLLRISLISASEISEMYKSLILANFESSAVALPIIDD
jgi:hypothetical protein